MNVELQLRHQHRKPTFKSGKRNCIIKYNPLNIFTDYKAILFRYQRWSPMNGRFSCDTIATSFGADSLLFLLGLHLLPHHRGVSCMETYHRTWRGLLLREKKRNREGDGCTCTVKMFSVVVFPSLSSLVEDYMIVCHFVCAWRIGRCL